MSHTGQPILHATSVWDGEIVEESELGSIRKVTADSLPMLRLRLAAPTALVDLGRIDELRGIREDGDTLVIGAMTSHHEVLRSPAVAEHALLLAAGARTLSVPFRRRGFGQPARPTKPVPAPWFAASDGGCW